jgi:hypothetical protein
MKINAPVLAGFVGSLMLTAASQAAIIGVQVSDITSNFSGGVNPMYPAGAMTFQISLVSNSAADILTNFTMFGLAATPGHSFFNADPIAHDPVGLINDLTGGNVPNPGVAGLTGAFPAYFNWAFDTFLQIDGTPGSGQEPVMTGLNSGTQTLIGVAAPLGGAGLFITPPFPTFGADSVIHIAQVTVLGVVPGQSILLANGTVTGVQGAQSASFEFQIIIPGPASLALLGLAGLVGTRRRRA